MKTQRAAACCTIGILGGFCALAHGQAEPTDNAQAEPTQAEPTQAEPMNSSQPEATNNAQAEATQCETAKFPQDVLERFPRINDACYDVVQKPDGSYAVFKADVTRINSDGIDVRFVRPNGDKSEIRRIETSPEFRVDVDGKSYEAKDLSVGQHLTAYIKTAAPEVAQQPRPTVTPARPLVPMEAQAPIPSTTPQQPSHAARAMPKTASPIPTLALIGVALVGLASGLRRLRKQV